MKESYNSPMSKPDRLKKYLLNNNGFVNDMLKDVLSSGESELQQTVTSPLNETVRKVSKQIQGN